MAKEPSNQKYGGNGEAGAPQTGVEDTNVEDQTSFPEIHESNIGENGLNGGLGVDTGDTIVVQEHKNNTSDGYYDA